MQVVQELKRTSYKPQMAILAAKKHYCVNETALNSDKGVDTACEDCNNAKAEKDQCKFRKNTGKLVGHALSNLKVRWKRSTANAVEGWEASHGVCRLDNRTTTTTSSCPCIQVHDIEDLMKEGKRTVACPYFAARTIADLHAELVFCPYNYIIDPRIRSAVSIQLSGAVVIFDEAHNIEDAAREAASIDVVLEEVHAALLDTHKPASKERCPLRQDFLKLQAALDRLERWLARFSVTADDLTTAHRQLDEVCRSGRAVPQPRRPAKANQSEAGVFRRNGDRLECFWSGGQVSSSPLEPSALRMLPFLAFSLQECPVPASKFSVTQH